MSIVNVKYKDWIFLVERNKTIEGYRNVKESGADSCLCDYCKNYVFNRSTVFPEEIRKLFIELGIDYTKEVEITTWETFKNESIHIGGWFHFIGEMISGESYLVPLPNGGYRFNLTKVSDNFSVGFAKGNDLSYFETDENLIQVEFDTIVPWLLNKKLD